MALHEMSPRTLRVITCLLTLLAVLAGPLPAGVDDAITVRAGYRLSIAVEGFTQPRFMELGPGGDVLFVSRPNAGEVRACRDTDGDGRYDRQTPFTSGRRTTHGLFWHAGWLWFTTSDAVLRARDTDGDDKADAVETILEDLPNGGGHWWRPILIHNGRIYTGIGDPGNITPEQDTARKKLFSYALDGSDERLFVSGIRNTEKLVVRPGSDEIWGMDHGSDWFGRELEGRGGSRRHGQPITDLNPPEEMNRYVEGGFYGHPYLVGPRIARYEYLDRDDIVELAARTIPPEWGGGAHWAANAMEFYTGEQFPGARGDAFVAYHGSWNSSIRVGYCVTRVLFEDSRFVEAARPYGELVYVRFLGEGDEVLGRPVDCLMEPDGSLLISDDHTHRIWRLRYEGTD